MSFLRVRALAVALGCAGVVLAGCGTGSGSSPQSAGGPTKGVHTTPSSQAPVVGAVASNIARGATGVPVDRVVKVKADHATLDSVTVTSKAGSVPGKLSADQTSWTAGALLEPGTSYTVRAAATTDAGDALNRISHFRTAALTLDQQTFPSITPLDGQTVGVGMPVIVHFDVPVTDHASIEKHLQVVSAPAQRGSWHWISDTEVHWRPATYWKAGTQVTVNTDINSVPAGNGIFGQLDRQIHFTVGDAHIYKVNAKTDQLRVFSNGQLLRTIPVTTGMPGFTTRSGVKVIVEKDRRTRMNSETIGIDPNSPNGYDLNNVEFAMRMTFSGEFLHAAPWSVAYQGHSNVSHGCTGMSTSNAGWLYHLSRVGDVVETTGTDRPMTLTNGYGDWNESFKTYAQGSALH
ncbi:L,D-transpeptidase [Nocardioides cynanchi]|uniref:L,D-transpeptidase n=1 Tax=Nocardioides cynanchi TaxID=2558918 RepID=UPI0012448A7C|nr:Ig-like domain-containing protein [Nocardioides cynanchi]